MDSQSDNQGTGGSQNSNSQSNGPMGGMMGGNNKTMLIIGVGFIALILGAIIGYSLGSSSSAFNPCGYGIPNVTNSSLVDGIDAFQIVLVNASFSEINVTSGYCNTTNLTPQQSSFVANAFK